MLLYELAIRKFDKSFNRLRDTCHLNLDRDAFREMLDSCEVFEASNVGEYFFSVLEKDSLDAEDYPNIRPPFENMWIERGPVEYINVNGVLSKIGRGHCANVRWGTLIESAKQEGMIILNMFSFMQHGNDVLVYPAIQAIRCDEDGKIVKDGDKWLGVFGSRKDAVAVMQSGFTSMTGYAMMALSFMHCKNVSLEKHYTNWQRYDGSKRRPGIKYHVLEIEPMKRILNYEGGANKTGLHKALHICRGHFKDYTEHGLFGRNKGLYWWDSHVRGDPSRGAVVKDYSIGSINA